MIQNSNRRTSAVVLRDFLFTPLDPYYTTILRVILSVAVFVVFWNISMPLSFIRNSLSLSGLYTNVFFTLPYTIAAVIVLILFCVGVRPRISGLLLSLLLLPLIFAEGFEKSRQVITFSILAFSLIPSRSQYNLIGFDKNYGKVLSPVWPVRLIQIQLSLLYLVNAVAKTTPGYLSGEVLQGLSIMMPNFLIDMSSGYFHLGQFQIPVYIAAISSVLIEYTLAAGFWFRSTRIPTAVLGVVFHVSLMYVVAIGKLDWASLFLYPVFLLPLTREHQSSQKPGSLSP